MHTFHVASAYLQVLKEATKKHTNQLISDKQQKQSASYQQKRRSARYSAGDTSTQHHYGVTAQQLDIPQDELRVLCFEYHSREIVDNSQEADKIERDTRKKSDSVLWHHHRRLRVTASNARRTSISSAYYVCPANTCADGSEILGMDTWEFAPRPYVSVTVAGDGVASYKQASGGVAQVSMAGRLVVHPIAKSIRQYLVSKHLMGPAKRR